MPPPKALLKLKAPPVYFSEFEEKLYGAFLDLHECRAVSFGAMQPIQWSEASVWAQDHGYEGDDKLQIVKTIRKLDEHYLIQSIKHDRSTNSGTGTGHKPVRERSKKSRRRIGSSPE